MSIYFDIPKFTDVPQDERTMVPYISMVHDDREPFGIGFAQGNDDKRPRLTASSLDLKGKLTIKLFPSIDMLVGYTAAMEEASPHIKWVADYRNHWILTYDATKPVAGRDSQGLIARMPITAFGQARKANMSEVTLRKAAGNAAPEHMAMYERSKAAQIARRWRSLVPMMVKKTMGEDGVPVICTAAKVPDAGGMTLRFANEFKEGVTASDWTLKVHLRGLVTPAEIFEVDDGWVFRVKVPLKPGEVDVWNQYTFRSAYGYWLDELFETLDMHFSNADWPEYKGFIAADSKAYKDPSALLDALVNYAAVAEVRLDCLRRDMGQRITQIASLTQPHLMEPLLAKYRGDEVTLSKEHFEWLQAIGLIAFEYEYDDLDLNDDQEDWLASAGRRLVEEYVDAKLDGRLERAMAAPEMFFDEAVQLTRMALETDRICIPRTRSKGAFSHTIQDPDYCIDEIAKRILANKWIETTYIVTEQKTLECVLTGEGLTRILLPRKTPMPSNIVDEYETVTAAQGKLTGA